MWTVPMRPFSDGEPNGAFSLVPKANSPATSTFSTPSMARRRRSAPSPPSLLTPLPPLLDRRHLERGASFDGHGEIGAERGGDAHAPLPFQDGDRVLRPLRRPMDVVHRQV